MTLSPPFSMSYSSISGSPITLMCLDHSKTLGAILPIIFLVKLILQNVDQNSPPPLWVINLQEHQLFSFLKYPCIISIFILIASTGHYLGKHLFSCNTGNKKEQQSCIIIVFQVSGRRALRMNSRVNKCSLMEWKENSTIATVFRRFLRNLPQWDQVRGAEILVVKGERNNWERHFRGKLGNIAVYRIIIWMRVLRIM